jgi:Thioredoxin
MATVSNLHQVKSSNQFKELLSDDLQRVSLLYFWAPWAEPCKQMTEVVVELSRKYPRLLSLHIEAEEQSDISESFDIESVPSFIILRVRCTIFFLGNRATQIHRVTLYSPASRAQMPAPSPMPSRDMWAQRSLSCLFPVQRSPPRRLPQPWRRQRSSKRASADS